MATNRRARLVDPAALFSGDSAVKERRKKKTANVEETCGNLADGDHEENPAASRFDDDGNELGVDGAQRAVPRHPRHSHVVQAVLGFPCLREDMAELALPHHTSPERHFACQEWKILDLKVCFI